MFESRVDTDGDGKPDLVKVSIIRPSYEGQIPAVMTASPYHQGTNDKASDKALHNMNVDLACKNPRTITVQESSIQTVEPQGQATLVETAEEKLGHIGSYTLNDYLLPSWLCQSLRIWCWNQGFRRDDDQWRLSAD